MAADNGGLPEESRLQPMETIRRPSLTRRMKWRSWTSRPTWPALWCEDRSDSATDQDQRPPAVANSGDHHGCGPDGWAATPRPRRGDDQLAI
uniref:Uncharacterized protein n=1 Tax=Oryza nivara TaxID=4536 RepID=A0A0E0INY1_ORYNI